MADDSEHSCVDHFDGFWIDFGVSFEEPIVTSGLAR